jgi:hypothetical protein
VSKVPGSILGHESALCDARQGEEKRKTRRAFWRQTDALARGPRQHFEGLKRTEINKNGTGNILATGSLVIVNVHALLLDVRVSLEDTILVQTMLLRDNLPKLGAVCTKIPFMLANIF